MTTISSSIRILAILSLLLITGCATVTRGSMDTLEVTSQPADAHVKVYRTNAGFTEKEIKNNEVADEDNPGAGPLLGKTPATFRLARRGEYRVLIEKEGYESVEVEVGHKLSGAGGAGMAGNAIAGGIIGVVIDARTGATQDLTPNPIEVTLAEGSGLRKIALEKKKTEKDGEEEAQDEAPQDESAEGEDETDAPAPAEAMEETSEDSVVE